MKELDFLITPQVQVRSTVLNVVLSEEAAGATGLSFYTQAHIPEKICSGAVYPVTEQRVDELIEKLMSEAARILDRRARRNN